MPLRPTIDVSELPGMTMGSQAPVWWGNLLFTLIETVSVALLVASYFYLAQNFSEWPPPSVHRMTPQSEPLPDLTIGTWVLVLLVGATGPMLWADKGAHKLEWFPVVAGLLIATVMGIAAVVLRLYEFAAVQFRWDENAYASVVWALLFVHLLYIVLDVAESGIDVVWTVLQGLDEKHASDVTLTTGYWFWTAGGAVVVYVVVYWAPRLL